MWVNIHTCPIHPNWVDLSEALYDSIRFAWSRSALPEVKIREIMMHELSLFDTRRNDSCQFDQIESNWQHFQPTLHRPGKLYFLSLAQIDFRYNESTQGEMIRVDSIDTRGNDLCRFHERGFKNMFPVSRIANTKDESPLVGCTGQPSEYMQSRS